MVSWKSNEIWISQKNTCNKVQKGKTRFRDLNCLSIDPDLLETWCFYNWTRVILKIFLVQNDSKSVLKFWLVLQKCESLFGFQLFWIADQNTTTYNHFMHQVAYLVSLLVSGKDNTYMVMHWYREVHRHRPQLSGLSKVHKNY